MIITEEDDRRKVLAILSDESSSVILMATTYEAKSIPDIAEKYKIPLATAYRRVEEMNHAGLITRVATLRSKDGRPYDTYRSLVKAVSIRYEDGSIILELIPNEDMAGRFMKFWGYVGGAKDAR